MVKLSRSKLELFTECQRCFWLDVKQGVKRPPGFPFTINNAIDALLKAEFDVHRAKGTRHAAMKKFKIDAVPFAHENLDRWRHNFTGVQFGHEATGFLVYGAVDDLWVNPAGELIVVDYKATGAEHKIHDSYRRQMEIYQWLLRRNGFAVSATGYFLFAQVNKGRGFGNGEAALSFDLFIEPLVGDDSWVEHAITGAKRAYDKAAAPEAAPACEYCHYRDAAAHALKKD
ncbi:MAG TPA: PD-(D/E)XK nuclease family protein [Candidatus Paceibacterota bacterium]|nr:PD-(D/E)XK nuclease family protein [Candidatus Paceibacterota bacterium]